MKQTPNRSRIQSLILATAFALVSGAAALSPATATAQEGSETASVEVTFWVYSANPQFFAYHTTNHLDAQVFFVGQAGLPDPVYTRVLIEGEDPRDIVISQEMRDAYTWAADGVVGNTSPSGYSTIDMTLNMAAISITLQQGNGPASPSGSALALVADDQITVADVEIRDVYWSPDETVAVVVLHQSLGGAWPLEVDTVHGIVVPERPEEEAPPAPE